MALLYPLLHSILDAYYVSLTTYILGNFVQFQRANLQFHVNIFFY